MSDSFWIALFGGIPGMIAAMAAGYIAVREANLRKKAESEKKSYQEMTAEATDHLEVMEEREERKTGKRKKPKVADVIPEHNSPTTPEQSADAELQTARARLVAVTKALDLPIREAAPMEKSPEAKAITKKAEEIKDKTDEITEEAKKITDRDT